MSIEEAGVIDAIGIEHGTGVAVLTIADPLEWGDDDDGHIAKLQEKINTYLMFIESGEIFQSYPAAVGRALRIDIVFRAETNESAVDFLRYAEGTLRSAGVELKVARWQAGDQ